MQRIALNEFYIHRQWEMSSVFTVSRSYYQPSYMKSCENKYMNYCSAVKYEKDNLAFKIINEKIEFFEECLAEKKI